MKKEWVEKDHCPYCKRHCSLQNPHCRKGKSLAEELKKEDKKKEELNQLRSDLSLFLLYLKGSESLLNKIGGKSSEKKIRHYILNLLAEKVEVTPFYC